MEETEQIYQRLTAEGADLAILEQYGFYQKTENLRGQYGLVCRFRREKNEELQAQRERLACLDYMIAKVEREFFGRKEG